ncbi:hypothetical protein [Mesorhizobium sp. WSM3626]|uniref:hypothetical protein n=1 Tax=Mesorhizobium sp. WSM3626 TaxID=1040987 RepID=UPI00048A3A09|nr:hypothetical protein [Mesorhizobium sp. WSM3626]
MQAGPLDAGKQAELVGKPLLAIAIVVIYGVYRVAQEGVLPFVWPNGTILVVGGTLSAVCVFVYARTIESGAQPSARKAVAAFSGLIPYAYSLYVIGYVGIWSLIQLFTVAFTIFGLLLGLFGVLLGYRILKTFYDITEVGNAQLARSGS